MRLPTRWRIPGPSRVALATVFVGASLFIIQHNVRETIRNPDLGTRYVNVRLAELMREIEGIDPPTRQGMANLLLGDGMRFVAFLAEHLPKDTEVIFPTDEQGSWKPSEYFSSAGYNHFKPLLHPRKIQTEVYDYKKLPYNSSPSSQVPDGYKMMTRDYSHSSRRWVMRVLISPEAKRYRLFFDSHPITGDPINHTENLALAYPEGPNP